ncbi:MAG: amino acid ABC transporter ATP-binding protein [Erysipelotrichaceae bacterium]|uniref:amino acid ABC transporter ATP-binding protein n=1 Tax=Humidesulfovibrio sp. TaxID=2910988 RepID=UPI0027332901|nr:amino acid ABC transporter ATP-binding protein [Humidesulfovibrio sp.]MDP2848991.1 amino acid ABC transporter ATP-binding protein [Humidesulfovibrio sp.]MDP3306257.1 amino acid ABC transporter ATP-binding protein [Erysipelotrichaceae bacterium]
MIKVENLFKQFDQTEVLKNINIEFEDGKTYAIIGSSGSGKSTLLRCLNGLEKPTSGKIVIDGVDIVHNEKTLPVLRQKIGMVFQSFNLFAHMNATDNITFALMKVKKMSEADAKQLALEKLTEVGCDHRTTHYPHQLSGGEKQRVAIARALAMKPTVILFDEPTSALDPEMTVEVLKVMKNLTNSGMTIIVVTHEMNFAKEVSDLIIYMDNGEIVEINPPKIFFEQTQSERAKKFLNNML